MAKRIVTAALALLLSTVLGACASHRAEPGIEIITVDVPVLVEQPCPATRPDRPDRLAVPLPSDPVALAALLGAKLVEYAGEGQYADQAELYFETCPPHQSD